MTTPVRPLGPAAQRVRAAAAPEAAGALVLLHGRGANEHDLAPLADALDPARRLVVVLPRAPLALPPGGAHWYAFRQVGFPDPATFHDAYAGVAAWLDELPGTTGVPLERTVLGGFSQGAVMTYALALGRGRPKLAGLIGLSGFVPTVDDFELDLHDREGLRAAIGHGTADPIIGVEWGRDARVQLASAGADVLYRESPVGHSIDPSFLAELAGWLERTLP